MSPGVTHSCASSESGWRYRGGLTRITLPPDFDHVVSAEVSGAQFFDAELSLEHSGVTVTFAALAKTPRGRLKLGEKLTRRGHIRRFNSSTIWTSQS